MAVEAAGDEDTIIFKETLRVGLTANPKGLLP
jgi:hypothetical protein